jgi:hypothetical protein
MTSRERVKKAIALERPDITPVDYWVLPSTYLKHGGKFVELMKKYPKDFSDALDVDEANILPPSHRKGEFTDCFGSVCRQEHDGFLTRPAERFPSSSSGTSFRGSGAATSLSAWIR